ncbi:DNA primase family protein [Pontibacter pamirensis]|uniref:DNA primase family protein n=1 Tax=Pontibacter pamirensis TaxID=2562824 RepID=UPI00138A15F9|nr:DNA primase family protein [Pontibacter pamirensis]
MTKTDNTSAALPTHEELPDRLLPCFSETDFREAAKLKDGQRLKTNHYLVTVIENVLETARQQQCGLCMHNGSVYLYNGAFWKQVEESAVKDFLGSAAERMGINPFDARFHLFKEQLYRQFLSSAKSPKKARQKGTVLVNLQDGTFEISPRFIGLREFREEDFMTYQLSFGYDEGAQAPLFLRYLDQVLPDAEKQAVVSEYLGYVFVDQTVLKLEKVLFCYGTGANGKSVLFEVSTALLGLSNVCSYSMQSITDQNGYSRAMLGDKLLNYASELSSRLDPNVFKQLTSGEPIEVRLPYKEPAILHSYAKLLFNCNELPRDIEHTDAFFRRLLIVEFDRTIPDEEQDRQLASKIIASELSGVFNWILQGLRRLMDRKRFSHCEAAKAQVALYKKESDSVQMFLEENGYRPSNEKCLALKEIYSSYRSFCQEDGYRPLNCTNFKKRLSGAGVQVVRRNSGWVVYLEMVAAEI